MSDDGPYALNENGSARDPVAFREALRADPQRMAALHAEPEVEAVVLGDDNVAFQELLKDVYQVCTPTLWCLLPRNCRLCCRGQC